MKNTANIISALRIILSPFILLTVSLTPAFFGVYFLCGLTDILDGYIARKTQTESLLGAKLDTLGDIVFTAAIVVFILKSINITSLFIIFFIVILTVKTTSIIIGFIKYKVFSPVHSYLNKFTGILLFILPIIMAFMLINIAAYIILTVALVAAMEELLIILFCKSYNENQKTFFNFKNNSPK